MGVIAVLRDLPVAVIGVVAVPQIRVAANAICQQKSPLLHRSVDFQAVSGKVGLTGLDALHREDGAAVGDVH